MPIIYNDFKGNTQLMRELISIFSVFDLTAEMEKGKI